MVYLCCDTNIWINISNSQEPTKLLDALYKEISNDNVKLILPSIIIKEWNRNKESKVLDIVDKQIGEQTRALHKLHDFLKLENETSFDEFLYSDTSKLANRAIELKTDILKHKDKIKERAQINIRKIEEIFQHANTILLEIDERTSLKVIKIFAEKNFPFDDRRQKGSKDNEKIKNNFADCLIFHQFVQFIKDNTVPVSYFVSSNKDDFYPSGELHESYVKETRPLNIVFHRSLGEAMNASLNKEFVTLNEIKQIKIKERRRRASFEEGKCIECDLDENDEDYNPFDSIVYFYPSMTVYDYRLPYKPKQPRLFDYYREEENEYSYYQLLIGKCGNCDTEQFLCPECEEICETDWTKPGTIKHTNCCDLPYIIFQQKDSKGEVIKIEFRILGENINCENCQSEFDMREDLLMLCEKCLK